MRPTRPENRLKTIVSIALVLVLLGQAGWARPKAKGTLQFIYRISEEDTPAARLIEKRMAETARRVVNYAALRAWLAKQEEHTGFPKEYRLDLNGDGHPEVFLRVLEHQHFAEYSVFTSRGERWIYIGEAQYCEPPMRLARGRAGWRDFAVDVTGPRSSLERRYFQWDPKGMTYDLSYRVTLRPMEQDPSETRN